MRLVRVRVRVRVWVRVRVRVGWWVPLRLASCAPPWGDLGRSREI